MDQQHQQQQHLQQQNQQQQNQNDIKLSPNNGQQNNCEGGGLVNLNLNGHVDYGQPPGAPVAIPVSIHGSSMVLHGGALVPNNPVDLSSPARLDDRRHIHGFKHHSLQPIGTLLNLGKQTIFVFDKWF